MTSSHPQVQWEGYSSCSVPEAQGTENDTHRHGDGETSSWVVVECVDVVGSGVDGAWAESQFVYICAGFPAKGKTNIAQHRLLTPCAAWGDTSYPRVRCVGPPKDVDSLADGCCLYISAKTHVRHPFEPCQPRKW